MKMYNHINLKTAKLAKEVGFDWICHGCITESLYNGRTGLIDFDATAKFQNFNAEYDYSNDQYIITAAPPQHHLQKWLRETHNIHIAVIAYDTRTKKHPFAEYKVIVSDFRTMNEDSVFVLTNMETYEVALERGLYEGLKLINKN